MVAEINHGLQEHQPHVVALTETWLKKGTPTPKFPGYSVHRLDRTSGEKNGDCDFYCDKLFRGSRAAGHPRKEGRAKLINDGV